MPTVAVELRDVSFTYPGLDQPALEGINLEVLEHERLGILGPNGGGKSTLLKLVLGLLPLQSGSISIFGQEPKVARDAGLIGYVAQRNEAEIGFPLSVRQVVTLAASWRLRPWQSLPGAGRARVDELLGLVGIGELGERPIGSLSGGQLQRALIARALACAPKLLVLDEPTVGIDAAGQAQFAELLTTVHKQLGLTLLVVSHDLRAIAAGCDRVACLSCKLHSHMSPQGLTPRVLAELFSHDVAGLAGIHIHAHGPEEPCPVELGGGAGGRGSDAAGGLVQLGVPVKAQRAVEPREPGQRGGRA